MADWIFSIGNFIFTIALLPSVLSPNKPHLATCMLTAVILTIYAATFHTMGLLASFGATAASAILWWVLVIQYLVRRYRQQWS